MRDLLVQYYLDKLASSLGKPQEPVAEKELLAQYKEKNYAGMVSIMKSELQLSTGMRIGWPKVETDPAVPVWIGDSEAVPPYGSDAFKTSKFTLFIQRWFIEDLPFEMTVMAIAPVLTHLLLLSKRSDLVEDIMAIDVACMFLGFSEFFLKKESYVHTRRSDEMLEVMMRLQPGCISYQEAVYADSLIKKLREE